MPNLNSHFKSRPISEEFGGIFHCAAYKSGRVDFSRSCAVTSERMRVWKSREMESVDRGSEWSNYWFPEEKANFLCESVCTLLLSRTQRKWHQQSYSQHENSRFWPPPFPHLLNIDPPPEPRIQNWTYGERNAGLLLPVSIPMSQEFLERNRSELKTKCPWNPKLFLRIGVCFFKCVVNTFSSNSRSGRFSYHLWRIGGQRLGSFWAIRLNPPLVATISFPVSNYYSNWALQSETHPYFFLPRVPIRFAVRYIFVNSRKSTLTAPFANIECEGAKA